MRSIFRIPSDEMAGDALRRVPIHHYRRKVNAKHFQDPFRRYGRGR